MVNNNPTKIGTKPKYISRELEGEIEKYLKLPQILAIVGPRRSGKTTLLLHFKENLPNSIFLSFEDEDLLFLFEKDIKSFAKIYIEPYQTIILDEFQYAKTGGQKLKYLYDFYPGKKIIISGSSSIELTVKAIKFLVGRILTFSLYPFSFPEFLLAKNPALAGLLTEGGVFSEALNKQMEFYLGEYLVYGGYPEVVLAPDYGLKQTILKNIQEIYFLKDVANLAGLIDDWKLKKLVKILAANLGGVVNYTELAAAANIDFRTLKSYLSFLEKTFIILTVPPFFTNKNKELTKNPKIYFGDLGLRNALINSFEPLLLRNDVGFLLENLVALELAFGGLKPRFWRTKARAEVDFVVEKGENKIPIEVKISAAKGKITRGFRNFITRYQPEKAFIANLNFFGEKQFGKTSIVFLPPYLIQVTP